MRRKGLLLILSLFVLLTGCATVKVVDQNGQPVPDHVVRGSVPSMGMRVDFALIHYFGAKEGKELLDTYEYLNPYDKGHSIKLDNLRSLTLTVHISNPMKQEYSLVSYFKTPSTDLDGNVNKQHPLQQEKVLYKGKLSRKEFVIPVPSKEKGFDYEAWFEIRDQDNMIRFMSPIVRYEVSGRQREEKVALPISKEDRVAGVSLDDPSRVGH